MKARNKTKTKMLGWKSSIFRVAPAMTGRVACLCETVYYKSVIALINSFLIKKFDSSGKRHLKEFLCLLVTVVSSCPDLLSS